MAIKKMENGTWRYDVRDPNGKRKRVGGFPTKKDAKDAVAVLRTSWLNQRHKIRRKVKHNLTVKDELVKQAQKIRRRFDPKNHLSKRYQELAKQIEIYSELLPDIQIDLLTEEHLEELVEYELKRGIKPQTINTYIQELRFGLRGVKKDNKNILRDWDIPNVKTGRTAGKNRTRIISMEEERRILDAFNNPENYRKLKKSVKSNWTDSRDIFTMAILTGMRKSEILTLMWSDIYFEWNVIKVNTLKQGDDKELVRDVPMSRSVRLMLEERKERLKAERVKGGQTYVFPRHLTEPHGRWLYAALRRVFKIADVPYGRDVKGGVVLHDTRHTATSRMLQNGADIVTVAEIIGDKPETLMRIYAHSTIQSKHNAINSLDSGAGAEWRREFKPNENKAFSASRN